LMPASPQGGHVPGLRGKKFPEWLPLASLPR
jgi:hypothetical protein